jgi:AraC-like DNA-binding protein
VIDRCTLMRRVSTDHVPEPQRLGFIHDFVAQHWAGMRFSPLDEADLHIDIAVFDLPDAVGIAQAHYPPMVGRRPRDLLSDGRDNYTVAQVSEDHDISIEGGRAFTVAAGDLILVSEGTWFEIRHPRAARVDVVSLGRSQLAARLPRLDLAPFYHVPGKAPGAALFAGYANLLRHSPPEGDKARQTAANHIHDLLAVVLDAGVSAAANRNEVSIGAARLELIKKAIVARSSDPSLNITSLASEHGVTPRYVQHLFEREGTTFTEFLRNSRLALAFQRLEQGAAKRSIAQIAFESGFTDLSNFNRAFRRRYGVTPSEVRAQAMSQR